MTDKYRESLRAQLKPDGEFHWWLMTLNVPLAVVESILTARAFGSATIDWTYGLTLFAVALIHLVLVGYLAQREKFRSAPALMLEASDMASEHERAKKEIERRTTTYRAVRRSLERLSERVCMIRNEDEEDATWCTQGFQRRLDDVFKPFISSALDTFGATKQPTLEVHLEHFAIRMTDAEAERVQLTDSSHLIVGFFGESENREGAFLLPSSQLPAHRCSESTTPVAYAISDDTQRFFKNGEPAENIYFRRYAAVPIQIACSPEEFNGVLVLTSMQEEPFADDVIDILDFVQTMIGNLLFAYNECLGKHDGRFRRLEFDADGRPQLHPDDTRDN